MPAIQQDPYIGKIVKSQKSYNYIPDSFSNTTVGLAFCIYYGDNSLFLVVGNKEKQNVNVKEFSYILKPLGNDEYNKNMNKDLVWCHYSFHKRNPLGCEKFQIVE